MKTIYRDGIAYELDSGSVVKTRVTADGHVVESWKSNGKKVYFVYVSGTPYSAHGGTLEEALADALWKDPAKRPERSALLKEIQDNLDTRKITVNEFRLLTGACSAGCREFLKQHNLPADTSMTLKQFKPIGGNWGKTLEDMVLNGG